MTTPWPEVRLGDVATIERSGIAPEAIASGTTYVGLENMTSDGRFEGHGPVDAGELASQKFRFSADHVLYGKLRPYLAKIATPSFSGVCSTDILPIRPSGKLDKRFLFRFLRQPSQVAKAASLATGANLPRLSPKVLADIPMLLPPVGEQRRIAAILDAADELRAKRRKSLALLDSLAEAIFLDMFGDPVENPREFEKRTLVELSQRVTKGTTPTSVGLSFSDGGVPFLRAQDLYEEQVDVTRVDRFVSPATHRSLARSVVEPRDVLLSIAGTIGRCAVVPDGAPEMNCNQAVAIIRVGDELRPLYLSTWLRTGDAIRQISGAMVTATIANLSLGQIGRLRLPVPPLNIQDEYERCLNQVRTLRRRMLAGGSAADGLFASLQHRAFRGEL